MAVIITSVETMYTSSLLPVQFAHTTFPVTTPAPRTAIATARIVVATTDAPHHHHHRADGNRQRFGHRDLPELPGERQYVLRPEPAGSQSARSASSQ